MYPLTYDELQSTAVDAAWLLGTKLIWEQINRFNLIQQWL